MLQTRHLCWPSCQSLSLIEDTINSSACFDLGRIMHVKSLGCLHTKVIIIRNRTRYRYQVRDLRNYSPRVFSFWDLWYTTTVDDGRYVKGGQDRGDRDPQRRVRNEPSRTDSTAKPKSEVGCLCFAIEETLRVESERLGENRFIVQHSPSNESAPPSWSPGFDRLTTDLLLQCCSRGGNSPHTRHPQLGGEEPLEVQNDARNELLNDG